MASLLDLRMGAAMSLKGFQESDSNAEFMLFEEEINEEQRV